MLMNNQHVRELAAAFADRVVELAQKRESERLEDHVQAVYEIALSRSPSSLESEIGVETLRELRAAWKDKPQAAIESYCHTILNSAAFLYVD
jgi:hypothetical protein